MPGDLTNSQIALLCAIEEHDPANSTDDQKRDLERLVLVGYVQPAGSSFELTANGVAFLGELGAGLNEA
jgi:hypothetical protein